MTAYLISVPILLAILTLVCLGDRSTLRRAYAKPMAFRLNAARWLAPIPPCLARYGKPRSGHNTGPVASPSRLSLRSLTCRISRF